MENSGEDLKNELKPTGILVRLTPTQEEITQFLAKYEAEGWTRDDSEERRGVVSPDGRWYKGWRRADGFGLHVDLHWIKNMKIQPMENHES